MTTDPMHSEATESSSGLLSLIVPSVARDVTSTAATRSESAHGHDMPARSELSGLAGARARERDRELERRGDRVEGRSDGARYGTLVIDPPWSYEGFGSSAVAGQRVARGELVGRNAVKRPPLPYASLDVEEIAALPIAELAAADAWVWLWTTNRYLPAAFGVLEAWGCSYRQTLVWRKTGCPSPFGGTVAPSAHAEWLLLASIGSPRLRGRLPSSVIAAPAQRQHSRKPEVFLDYVETVCEGPFVELFARRQRLGWDTWGNQALEHVEVRKGD